MGHPQGLLGDILWNIGFIVCHQYPERSFFIDGYQLPVCARDTGTLIGFLIILVYALVLKRYRNAGIPDKWIIAFSMAGFIFFAFDGLSSYMGFRLTTNEVRFLSGIFMGSGMAFFIVLAASFILFRGDTAKKTFTWKDIPPVVCLLSFVSVGILLARNGIATYYLISIVIVASLLTTEFLLLNILLVLLLKREINIRKNTAIIMTLTIVLEASLMVILWQVHKWSSALKIG